MSVEFRWPSSNYDISSEIRKRRDWERENKENLQVVARFVDHETEEYVIICDPIN
jgi:hypothetical protein